MMNRVNLALTILLAAQAALIAVSVLGSANTTTRAIEPLLAGLSAADIDRLVIADELDNTVAFGRGDAGWVLPGADAFPVTGEKVDEILSKLLGLDTRRLIASNPANFSRLEVKDDDFRRRATVGAGELEIVLYLGGSGGADTVYARRAGEDSVYLGVGLNSWELATQTSTWVDANYVNVPQEDVLEIRARNAMGEFRFTRDGDAWLYAGLEEGEVFEDTRMPGILRNAASIRLMEPLGLEALEAYGLAEPQVTVEVRYRVLVEPEAPVDDAEAASEENDEAAADEPEIEYREASYRLEFGAEIEDGQVALKSSDADYYVSARDTTVNVFRELRHDALVKAPESSDPAASE